MSGKFGGGGKKCVLCAKTAYTAEQISFEKEIYHVNCFKCTSCNKKMGADKAKKHDGKLYDTRCWNREGFGHQTTKVVWTKKTTTDGEKKSGGSSRFGGGGSPCSICTKNVYQGEKVNFTHKMEGKQVKKIYHPKCFACVNCHQKKTPAAAAGYNGDIYCNMCFGKLNLAQKQTKQTWKASGTSTGGSGKYGGGGAPCSVCKKTVFSGEKVTFDKIVYHPNCFRCGKCTKKMTPGGAQMYKPDKDDKSKNEIFCLKCFKNGGYSNLQASTTKNWTATKGSTGGSSKFGGGGTKCTTCGKTVYTAEQVAYDKKIYHPKCLTCTDCGNLTSVNKCNAYEGQIKCKKCWNQNNYKEKQTHVKKDTTVKSQKTDSRFTKFGGGGVKCVKCTKTVYPAELIQFEKHAYHAKCFVCENDGCGKKLKQGNALYVKGDNNALSIYCDKCFHVLGLNRAHIKTHHDEQPSENKEETTENTETTEDTSEKTETTEENEGSNEGERATLD